MKSLDTTLKKPTVIIRTFASDMERVRKEGSHAPAKLVRQSSTPVPKIGIKHIPHSTQHKATPAKELSATTSPLSPVRSPAPSSLVTPKIKLKQRQTIPKPVIVTPTKPLATAVASEPTRGTANTTPVPKAIIKSGVSAPKKLKKSSGTVVTIGDDTTDERATIITDTKHKRFRFGRSVRLAISNWWHTLSQQKSRSKNSATALPAASERQGVIKRATTISGTVATAHDTRLTARVHNRGVTPPPTPSSSLSDSNPALTWTANTEPGFPLLEIGSDTAHINTERLPVIVEYKKFTRPGDTLTTIPALTTPNEIISPRVVIPSDPQADARWGVIEKKLETQSEPSEISEEPYAPEKIIPDLQSVLPTPATDPSEQPKVTVSVKKNLEESDIAPVIATHHETPPADEFLSSEISPVVDISDIEKTPAPNASNYLDSPSTPIETTSTVPAVTADTPPIIPAYTKRQRQARPQLPITDHVKELMLQGDTNILTLAIVGTIIGISMLGIGIWLLIRAFGG